MGEIPYFCRRLNFTSPLFMKNIYSLLLFFFAFAAASARELGDCQKWGYGPNDFSQLTTIDYLNAAGPYGVGILVPANKEWAECTIEGISVPVALTAMKNLTCFVASDAKFSKILATITVPDGTLTKGFNDIVFDRPIPMPDKNFYIGYTYTSTQQGASIVTYNTKANGGLYLNTGSGWMDYSPYGMGVSAMQLIVGSQSLSDYGVEFRTPQWTNVLCGPTTLRAVVRSSSKHPIDRFSYTVTIDGQEQHAEYVLPTPIPEGMDCEACVDLPFTAPATPQRFAATLSIDAIGTAENVQPDGPLTVQLNSVGRQATRRTVVEEFTGTACGYCPKGWLAMETLKERYPERFIGIAVHQYNQNDPMYCPNYARPGFEGAPSCFIDRHYDVAIDPYNGSGLYPNGMGDFDFINSLLPDVDVSLWATLAPDRKSVTAEADIEFLGQADGYTVAYVLTADGLTGTGAWLQDNYYSSMQPSAIINSSWPELAAFCLGGEYGQAKVQITFGDVLLASSWNASGAPLTEALPSATPGTHVGGQYTLALPTKPILVGALDYSQLYAVCIVFDQNGHVANAARAKVESAPDAIDLPEALTAPLPCPVYSIDGRTIGNSASALPANGRGITIQGGRKVLR